MLAQIDTICERTGVYPHAFLTGHVHNYQRFSRTVTFGGQQRTIPFVVCGASGHHINPIVQSRRGQPAQKPEAGSDVTYLDKGSPLGPTKLILQNFEDTDHGYLRATVDVTSLRFDYYTATPSADSKPFDSVTVDL